MGNVVIRYVMNSTWLRIMLKSSLRARVRVSGRFYCDWSIRTKILGVR